ncbi:MAG: hypothetical protein WD512_16605 [Candidatus Paceibacterota bacterium]
MFRLTNKKILLLAIITLLFTSISACSEDNSPDDVSQEYWEIASDTLSKIDECYQSECEKWLDVYTFSLNESDWFLTLDPQEHYITEAEITISVYMLELGGFMMDIKNPETTSKSTTLHRDYEKKYNEIAELLEIEEKY